MRSKVVLAVALVFGSVGAHAQEPAVEERTLELGVGEQVPVPVTDVKEFSEPIGGFVDLRWSKDKQRFFLVGLKPGSTTALFTIKDRRQIRFVITVRPYEEPGTVKARPDVRLDFYFVQLSNDASYRIGIGWPGSIGGTAQVTIQGSLSDESMTSATASVAAQALPRLDLLQSSGWVRILRQATIVVANGEQGHFWSGGELNFLVEGKLSTGIQSIQFGTNVQIRPRYDSRSGRSDIQLVAEVSDLTDQGNSPLPGRTVSRVETVVNLDLGQAIVLAGLHGRSQARNRTGLPFFSQLPIVGVLFGTHSGRAEETENLVFIIPSVVEPVSPEKRNLVEEAFRAFETYEGKREKGLPR